MHPEPAFRLKSHLRNRSILAKKKKADDEEPKTGGRGLEHLAELGEDLERMMKHLRGDKGGG